MKSFLKSTILFTLLFGMKFAMAAGTLHLSGKVVAFSPTEVTLEVKKKLLYIIDRTQLSSDQSSRVSAAGQVVSLDVPMPAVKNVKDEKN